MAVIGSLAIRSLPGDPIGVVLLVACAAPLVVRSRSPIAALALTAALAFAYDLLNEPGGFYTVALALALYSSADAGHRRAAAVAVVGVVGGFLAVGLLLGRGHVNDLANAAWFAGWLVASVVLGEVTRSRRAYVEEVELRALEAERTREEEARRRASEERVRIARELHDILAHRISVMNVQAGVGAHLFDRQPEQARAALLTIQETSREALRELRATLGALRQADEPWPRSPAPSLSELDGLVADMAAGGVEVRVDVQGHPRHLSSGVDLAAYRIVQESLTNVLRHARATLVRIAIAYRPDDVLIEVVDNGVGPAEDGRSDASGNGLQGMHERAVAIGGEVEAGPSGGGGFRVRARLPTPGSA